MENFRDLGVITNSLLNKQLFNDNVFFRSGSFSKNLKIIKDNNVKTIINLRPKEDPLVDDILQIHCPIQLKQKPYSTSKAESKAWLRGVVFQIAHNKNNPTLFHCASGKDRTGITAAAILKICGMEDKIIIKEYLRSKGKISIGWIRSDIEGIGNPEKYFYDIPIENIKKRFLK
jgi:protein tyrosine/serine phosphatase